MNLTGRIAWLSWIAAIGLFPVCLPAGPAEQVNPYPRQVCGQDKVQEWTFRDGDTGWKAIHDCTVAVKDSRLVITSTGDDPYVHIPTEAEGGLFQLALRAKCAAAGPGQFFYTTDKSPQWDQPKSVHFELDHDGKWHDYEVLLTPAGGGKLTGLRLDPGSAPGAVEIERLELRHVDLHPLEIAAIRVEPRRAVLTVKNHGGQAVSFSVAGRAQQAPAGQAVEVILPLPPAGPFGRVELKVTSPGLPDLARTAFTVDPNAAGRYVERRAGRVALRVASDGGGAWLDLDGKPIAAICPIVGRPDAAVALKVAEAPDGVRLEGDGIRAALALKGEELAVAIEADLPVEGPALRALGPLQQGLFAGLEYLGRGEQSSSALDIETPERLRYAPDVMKVTMPLMAAVTGRATAAMVWKDLALQPVFASPNFFDGSDDHRLALRGRKIEATILVRPPGPLEEAILWGVRKHGLPALPKAPRPADQQRELSLKALRGPIAGEGGWGHCAEARWARHPFADIASTLWRLSGQAPELPKLTPGGAHLRDEAIYFVTGRAQEWLDMRRSAARGQARQQKSDGSYRYQGPYQRGHYEDTASGWCARPALELLEFARQTGDAEALAAGLRTLEYMKRFDTPRGAQTWELSLHTPDILASAQLVGAYVRGYELTGRTEYLAEARRWALSGVPFVYLWGNRPVMPYATIAVYGATNWQAPNWMGLPVQWCGGVYAYWLAKLAPHDKTLDWHKLAEGILIAGEQMQPGDGPLVGCLPDSFVLRSQRPAGPHINPSAWVTLRLAVEGKPESLAVAASADGKRRVVSPFPAAIRDGKAHIQARTGLTYQAIIDGQRIVTVRSKGEDVVPLD